MAALDELRARHGLRRFHLAGQSGGAHTVAGLAQMRTDVGCAVMAAGVISVKTRARDQGKKIDAGTKVYTTRWITSPPCSPSQAEG
jgi:pimeloyl-ACP methyl ester carboxylesterase